MQIVTVKRMLRNMRFILFNERKEYATKGKTIKK